MTETMRENEEVCASAPNGEISNTGCTAEVIKSDAVASDPISTIASRYEAVLENVAAVCERCNRDPEDVLVLAVSKTVKSIEVREATKAGIHDFAENRPQIFTQKADIFPEENWHFIGKLQSNKVKDVVGKATLIHSVDSDRLLEALQARAGFLRLQQPVLIEVNVSGEESKSGLAPDEVLGVLRHAARMSNLQVKGLMTMAPQGNPEEARKTFKGLRELRDLLRPKFIDGPIELDVLSMGMSEDYEIALEEGATIIRIGRGIFDEDFAV